MSGRILLVTGSRALEGSAFADRARALLSCALRGLPGRSIVVTGDARGPDAWAAEFVTSEIVTSEHLQLALRVYALDGWVYDEHAARLRRWSAGGANEPLDRNVVMVADVAWQRTKDARVEVFGMEAVWSSTRGTAHTLGKARAAGLPITRITFERGN